MASLHFDGKHAGLGGKVVARTLAAIVSLVVASGLVATIDTVSATAATTKHGPARQCTAVADVLANGPTTDVDPVGYAEAQVLSLRQLKLSDPTLRRAVQQLDSAYAAVNASNGSHKAEAAAKVAEARVDAICPTAAP
jgi:hypothetical protein